MASRPSLDAPVDPLIDCIGHICARFGVSFAPSILSSLPKLASGFLPLHQAEPALELLGLTCDESKPEKLPRKARAFPAIVVLKDNHLAVLHEIRHQDVLVWRPGMDSEQWQPFDEVSKDYGGWFASVIGSPSALRNEGSRWEAAAHTHWFWSEFNKLRRDFWPVLLAAALVNFLALALPLFSMNVYDRVIPNRSQATLWVLAMGVLLAFAMDFAVRRARSNVLDELGRTLDLKLSQKIYSKILASPLEKRKGHTGNIVARVSEFTIVREFFASTTITLIVDALFLVLFLAVITYIASWLVVVPLLSTVVMAFMGFRLQRKVTRAAQEVQIDNGLQQALLVESVTGIETLKSIGGEGVMLGRWRQLNEMGSASQQRLRHISSHAISLAATCQQVSSIGLVVGGYYLFDAGKITMGAIIAVVMLASRSLAPASQLAFLLTRGQQARQVLDSLQQLWEEDDERRMGSASLTPQIRSASIKCEDLEFSYPETPVASLSGVNLEIFPGDRIAIVGRVASGKSTLGRVLCGLYRPTGGSILIDDIDSRQYRPQEIRSSFRYVGQDSSLFSGTIKDNLALGAHIVRDEDLLEALRKVAADQFLSRDSGGFDRSIGEAGIRLSGGQRSFLTLARALVSPSKMLFLDEPTGAMDSQTEKLFVERLSQSLTAEQTLLISTHRPALFAVCNRIIVIDKGRIVADGPRDQVISAVGNELKS